MSDTRTDTPESTPVSGARTIAIVGGGPRGLFALDCLSAIARSHPDRRFHVVLFEPSDYPGAGPVYAPDQPTYLIMNFKAGLIDTWDRSFADNEARPSFTRWIEETGREPVEPGAFVPRALVGTYLMACYERLVADLPETISLDRRQTFVTGVVRERDTWQVTSDTAPVTADEVLIVTGHQRWQNDTAELPVSVFPARRLAESEALSGTLRCKGFGLTFIDAALILSVGRGGRFSRDDDDRLVYHAAGDEPARIQPVSRTGRPMFAKPDAGVIEDTERRDAIVAELADTITAGAAPITDFEATIWPAFLSAADAYIDAPAGTTHDWFEDWRNNQKRPEEAHATLQAGWEMSTGKRAPGAPIALALVWRAVYPKLVRRISHGGMTPEGLESFRPAATEMERIAFGPAAANIERLLALIEAGIVDLSALGTSLEGDDYAIDATISAPFKFDEAGPLPELAEREHLLRTRFGTLAVDTMGRPYHERHATAVPGLAIIGRATELSVVGNDTLSRDLQDTMRDWARSVIADAADAAPDHPVPSAAAS